MKKLLRLALLLTAVLLFGDFAAAGSIVNLADVESDAELQAEIQAIFGSSTPFWTTADNVAEIDYLMGLASDPGGDDSVASEPLDPNLEIVLEEDISGALPLDALPSGDEPLADNAEPATLVLFGSGLIFLAGRAVKNYGARRRTHRSGSG